MKWESWPLIFAFLPVVLAYGDGPPTTQYPAICETMQPGHGASTATDPVPFAIRLTANEYKKAESIDVTVYAKEEDRFFRGFFLQARQGDGMSPTAIGSFISRPENGTQFIKCGTANSAWGHKDRLKKTSVTATWMGPSTDIGALVFNATVVGFNRTEYWTGIMSTDVTFGSANDVKSQSFVLSLMALLAYAMRG